MLGGVVFPEWGWGRFQMPGGGRKFLTSEGGRKFLPTEGGQGGSAKKTNKVPLAAFLRKVGH